MNRGKTTISKLDEVGEVRREMGACTLLHTFVRSRLGYGATEGDRP